MPGPGGAGGLMGGGRMWGQGVGAGWGAVTAKRSASTLQICTSGSSLVAGGRTDHRKEKLD